MKPQIKKASWTLALVMLLKNLKFKAKLKQIVVRFACYGLIPLWLADKLISAGSVGDE